METELEIPTVKPTSEFGRANMIADRYRDDQNFTRLGGIRATPTQGLAVECYAGQGTLTEVYKQHFERVLSNDLNKQSPAYYHMTAMKLIEEVIPTLDKIDLIDFDCYGCPALEIQKFFEVTNHKHLPVTVCFSDGLGQWMKRSKKDKTLRDRYMIEGEINWFRIWDRHKEVFDDFMQKLAAKHGFMATKINCVQTKNKNYILGAYRIT